jgi:hypothetical protein
LSWFGDTSECASTTEVSSRFTKQCEYTNIVVVLTQHVFCAKLAKGKQNHTFTLGINHCSLLYSVGSKSGQKSGLCIKTALFTIGACGYPCPYPQVAECVRSGKLA